MKLNSWLLLLIAVFALMGQFAPVLAALPKTKADAVDVPAIGKGFCVRNVFQKNMVIQRDKPIHVWGWAGPAEEVSRSGDMSEAGERKSSRSNKGSSALEQRART